MTEDIDFTPVYVLKHVTNTCDEALRPKKRQSETITGSETADSGSKCYIWYILPE